MGREKTTLPWRETTVIEAVVTALLQGGANEVVAVARKNQSDTIRLARRAGALVVAIQEPTTDMLATIGVALDFIQTRFQPSDQDCWLVTPADVPWLSDVVVARLISAHNPSCPRLLVPVRDGRRGHPLLIPWPWWRQALAVPPGAGLKRLFERLPWEEVSCGDELRWGDMDTPEDYQAAGVG